MLISNRRRLIIILAALGVIVAIIIGRLVYLQVINNQQIRAEHEELYGREEILEPIRGKVVDRNSSVLAITSYDYRIVATPNQVDKPERVADILSRILITRTATLMPLLDNPKMPDGTPLLYIVVAPRVSAETVQAIQEAIQKAREMDDNLGQVGIYFEPVPRRHYPSGQLFSHVLGWVTLDMQGATGLERYYEQDLRGEPVAVRQYPFLFGQWETARPHHGATLVLTLDRTVQYVTEQVLAEALERYIAPSGSIIVMDPRSYEILAMASSPTFDPNKLYQSQEDLELMMNPCVSEWFEPGSIHKVLTMAAAVDSGTVTPETVYQDAGILEVGGLPLYNWDRGAHGTTDMVTLLAKSLNVGAATIARWMGQETFYSYMRAFGLGDYTGVDLDGEIVGMVKRPGDDLWTEVDLGTNSFGQGIAVTPLQELVAITAIANDGVMLQPHLVAEIRDGDQVRRFQPTVLGQPISKQTADTVTWMMAQAVAREVPEAIVPGYTIAGKTGTAQIAQGGIYHPTDVIGSFVGFLPADDPQLIVFVKIDRPQVSPNERWGSMTAAPTFAKLAQQLVVLLDIPPDSERVKGQVASAQPQRANNR